MSYNLLIPPPLPSPPHPLLLVMERVCHLLDDSFHLFVLAEALNQPHGGRAEDLQRKICFLFYKRGKTDTEKNMKTEIEISKVL